LLCVSNPTFDFAFAVGIANAARHGDDAVVGKDIFEQRIERRIVDVRSEDAFLQVIENDQAATAAQAAESGLMQFGPGACTGTERQQANRFPAVAQGHDEQACPTVLARLRIADHRTLAVIDLKLLSGPREDDANRFGLLGAAEFANEAFDRVVGSAETMSVNQVLPDALCVATLAQSQFDRFPEWFANTLGWIGCWKWDGRFR
jgi:hypothetical protein